MCYVIYLNIIPYMMMCVLASCCNVVTITVGGVMY